MVRSGTSSKNAHARNHNTWSVFVCWFLAYVLGSPIALAQSKEVDSRTGASRPNMFLVSSSAPYSLPTQFQPSSQSLSAIQIGRLAAERCGPAKMVTSDSKSRSLPSLSVCKDVECEKMILESFQVAVAFRLRQTASANAMKLHYGIAACLTAERIFNETHHLLQQQEKAQTELVEKGIPIPDPLMVGRLKLILEDKRLDNQSKTAILRTQLSALIGTENACGHAPSEPDEILPSDCSVCAHIEQAMTCRCDLQTMKRLLGTIHGETLAVWDGIGAFLSGVPALAKQKTFWSKLVRTKRTQTEIERAIATRRKWLDELVEERTKQIAMEVDVAFEKKRTAALRWVKTGEQVTNWETRILQLENLSEVQGNLASQFEAKLNRLQAKGQMIERWVEWHQANIELMLAIGCDL